MGSRASQLINRQQQPSGTTTATSVTGDKYCDINNKHLNNHDNVKQILDANGNVHAINNNNDNIEDDLADEADRIKHTLRKRQANISNGLEPQSINDVDSATLDRNDQFLSNEESSTKAGSKFSTLQRQASHIQQALAQRIRRSSSFRGPTSKLRSFIPSFINGKRGKSNTKVS